VIGADRREAHSLYRTVFDSAASCIQRHWTGRGRRMDPFDYDDVSEEDDDGFDEDGLEDDSAEAFIAEFLDDGEISDDVSQYEDSTSEGETDFRGSNLVGEQIRREFSR
jgi:hypothetical protein